MASSELISLVGEIEKRANNGILDLKSIKILYDLTVVAFHTEEDVQYGLELSRKGKEYIEKLLSVNGLTFKQADEYRLKNRISVSEIDLYWQFVLEETFWDFQSFMAYMEKERPFSKKFYEPRRYTKDGKESLIRVARELQALEERKYKFLGVSLPARTGKSTICIFYLCWKGLRNPNAHSAMGGHAGTLVKGFYKELLNLMTSEEYTFPQIYGYFHPDMDLISDKSAEDFTITLGDRDRFATITCRGIDATWTGAVDISSNGVLYVDDLVRDRQHSLSPTRMEETFQEYLNKMVDRKNDGAQELMVGTLWNVLDPLERLRKMYEGNPEYRFLRIPALDENDESNFDYVVNGFSSSYYKEMRERLDNAEWQAKYQQQPYVREGLVFPSDQLKYFDGFVNKDDIKRVYSICDPAFGGGDSLSMPVCMELNNGRRLIVKWMHDRRTTKFTIPRVVDTIRRYGVAEMRIERNGAGLMLEGNIKDEMKKANVFGCSIRSVSAPNRMSKEDKINGYSDFIKDNFEFLLPKRRRAEIPESDDVFFFERDEDYQRAMDEMSMYTSEGKNPHDDAPDAMSQLAIMCENKRNGQVEVIHDLYGTGKGMGEWY